MILHSFLRHSVYLGLLWFCSDVTLKVTKSLTLIRIEQLMHFIIHKNKCGLPTDAFFQRDTHNQQSLK